MLIHFRSEQTHADDSASSSSRSWHHGFADRGAPRQRGYSDPASGCPRRGLGGPKRACEQGIETAAKQRPRAFFSGAATALITPGNFEDDLASLSDCDWIIEAVTESLDIKRRLWERVSDVISPTRGCPATRAVSRWQDIAEGFPDGFRGHFLGTHFFNPPRYLHLVEVIPGAGNAAEILRWVSDFCDVRLGKGVVRCKDTPNFIANRIGSFYGATVHKLTMEGDYTVEEVDAITGPLIGVPKSASFRLVDIVGLDVWVHVTRNLYELVPHDPARGRFTVPPFMERMMERGWLGEKRGQGFYKRVGKEKEIHALDLQTLEYHPAAKVKFASVEAREGDRGLPERLRALVAGDDRAGQFLWTLFRDYCLYSADDGPGDLGPRSSRSTARCAGATTHVRTLRTLGRARVRRDAASE